MRQQFTYGHLMTGIMGVMFLGIIVMINAVVSCDDKKCEQTLGTITLIGVIISLGSIVFGVFVPFFKSLSPVDIREELAEESGPTHGTLPKGFEQQKEKSV